MYNEQQSLTPTAQEEIRCLLQREVPCLNGTITLAIDQNEVCWISVPSVCKILGINTRGQYQRIARSQELAQVSQHITLSTRGGPQRVTCLKVTHIEAWLGTADSPPEAVASFLESVAEAAKRLRDEIQARAQQLLLPLDEKNITQIREPQAVAATLPGLGQILIVPSHAEDRAIREATLARQDAWRDEPNLGLPYYLASNQMRVYFGDPKFPLEPSEAQAALARLHESTIFTARFILARWNVAREQGQLAEEGSVPVRIEEILEWRGIKPHSRAVAPGSALRKIEDYEIKYKKEVHEDLRLLGQFWLQGTHHVPAGGRFRPINIDSYYLRVGRLQNPEDDRSLYFAAPGVWISTYLRSGGLWLAELDRRIFALNPGRHQIAMRLALFLSEHWQISLMNGGNIAPISMQELLTLSMILIDYKHLTERTVPQVERALQILIQNGIVKEARPTHEVSREPVQWGKDWLATRWLITPPEDVVQRHLQRARSGAIGKPPSPLLLSGPVKTKPETTGKTRGKKVPHTPSEEERVVWGTVEKGDDVNQPEKPIRADSIVRITMHTPFEESR